MPYKCPETFKFCFTTLGGVGKPFRDNLCS
jgi:hypothetical protein